MGQNTLIARTRLMNTMQCSPGFRVRNLDRQGREKEQFVFRFAANEMHRRKQNHVNLSQPRTPVDQQDDRQAANTSTPVTMFTSQASLPRLVLLTGLQHVSSLEKWRSPAFLVSSAFHGLLVSDHVPIEIASTAELHLRCCSCTPTCLITHSHEEILEDAKVFSCHMHLNVDQKNPSLGILSSYLLPQHGVDNRARSSVPYYSV